MEERDDPFESVDDKATELESKRHQGTISKDSTENLIQEEIADTVVITEEEFGGDAQVQSNEEGDTDEEDNH